MPNRSLEETLEYRCPSVIAHFRRYHFDLTEAEAEDVFIEMLRWLWLCGRAYEDRQQLNSDVPATMNVQAGMVVIDLLWHSFVLHTRQYAMFCQDYLGKFIHHSPANDEFIPPKLKETERQMHYISDNAGGAKTLEKWYIQYAEKYSVPKLRDLQRPFDIIQ